jgi:hypothetical protein
VSSHQSRTEYKVLFVLCSVPLSELLGNVDMHLLLIVRYAACMGVIINVYFLLESLK